MVLWAAAVGSSLQGSVHTVKFKFLQTPGSVTPSQCPGNSDPPPTYPVHWEHLLFRHIVTELWLVSFLEGSCDKCLEPAPEGP